MSDATLAPRTRALLSRVDAWADHGTGRRLLLKVGVTVVGPLVVLAGIAMIVLPGPGLVVMAAGVALLALEYPWARHALAAVGRAASQVREAVLPRAGSRGRRAFGSLVVAAVAAAGFVATSAITAFVGAHTVL